MCKITGYKNRSIGNKFNLYYINIISIFSLSYPTHDLKISSFKFSYCVLNNL